MMQSTFFVSEEPQNESKNAASFLIDKFLWAASRRTNALNAGLAVNASELAEAYGLVYRQYLEREYCAPHPSRVHYNFYALLPGSRTFVLRKARKMIGTISLVHDSPCGLPIESLFPYEIQRLRALGHRLGEASLLAVDGDGATGRGITDFEKLAQSFGLFKIMFDYARLKTGLTDLLIMVNPKHERVYRHMTFESLGPAQPYEGACGSPAVPMRLNIRNWTWGVSEKHSSKVFFSNPSEVTDIPFFEWTSELVFDFLFQQRQIWGSLSWDVRSYFIQNYSLLVPYLKMGWNAAG